MRTNPFFIGLANALIPGTGYLILQERVVFGSLLLAGTLSMIVLAFVEPAFIPSTQLISTTPAGKGLEVLWYALFTAAYAYDGYALAVKKRVQE